jgi:hypothetical protein
VLKGKKILIGVTGSIAAYKIPFLVRLLVKEGAEVKVILTPAARDFITPLTLSTLSGHPVYTDFFEKEDGTWHSHVDLGNWADVYLLAPLWTWICINIQPLQKILKNSRISEIFLLNRKRGNLPVDYMVPAECRNLKRSLRF